ncbi:MAG: DUF484 family protein [Burkholderiales bacterium]|jgi:hypothetical protein|nr:DUF484 family protein [Burkholderiales bacterium]
MSLTADAVAQFLRDNPAFLDAHPDVLDALTVPPPHGGQAIPIGERQLAALRDRNRALEDKLRELVQFGQENDATIERMHRFALAAMAARDLDALLATVLFHLREDFAVPHVALRLWTVGADARPESTPTSPEVRVFADSLGEPYCGAQAMFETSGWFGPAMPAPASFGYLPLRTASTFGVLALASDAPERFAAGTGTLYLRRIGELTSVALARFVTPA